MNPYAQLCSSQFDVVSSLSAGFESIKHETDLLLRLQICTIVSAAEMCNATKSTVLNPSPF